ncbi:MAG: Ig-like domain-containing protein, partial [Verrucomicrobiota bacterium]
ESPDIKFGGVSVPEFSDTLDFSALEQDLNFTVLEITTENFDSVANIFRSLENRSGTTSRPSHGIDIGMNIVIVTDGILRKVVDLASQILGFGDAIGSATQALTSLDPGLDLFGNIVIATDIENIIGSEGTNTFTFVNGAKLQGTISTGDDGKVVLNYSRYRLPGDTQGVTVDLGAGPNINLVEALGINSEILGKLVPIEWKFGAAEAVQGNRFGGLEQLPFLQSSVGLLSKNLAVTGVTKVIGTPLDDILTGNRDDIIFVSGGGNDKIDGGPKDKDGNTASFDKIQSSLMILLPLKEIQAVWSSLTTGNLTLTLGTQNVDVAYNASADAVRQALAGFGVESVAGKGTEADPWVLTFGAEGKNVAQLTSATAGASIGTLTDGRPGYAWSSPTGAIESSTVNDFWKVSTTATGGTFTLTLGGQTTAPIAYNAGATAVAAALRALPNGVASEVLVSGTGTTNDPWIINFLNPAQAASLLTASGTQLTPEGSTISLVQGKRLFNNAAGGTFQITFAGQTTADIAYDASAANLEKALEDLSNITNVTVTGSGRALDPWVILFHDSPAQSPPQFTINNTAFQNQFEPVREVQKISVSGTGGTFKLSYGTQTTANIAYNASADDVKRALDALTGIPEFSISGDGTAAKPWILTFIIPASADVPDLVVDKSGLASGANVTITTTTAGVTPVNEVQRVYRSAPGTFYFRFNSQNTVAISDNATADNVRAALQGLTNVEVTVTGNGTVQNPWLITFVRPGPQNVSALTAVSNTSTNAAATNVVISTKVEGVAPVPEVQQIWTNATSGNFKLTFGEETTGDIAYNSTAANLKTELERLESISKVTVTGAGTQNDPWIITFPAAAPDLAQLTANTTALTGGTVTIATERNGTNATPAARDDAFEVEKGATDNVLDVLRGDTDLDGDEITIIGFGATGNIASFTTARGATVTLHPSNRALVYRPTANFTGVDSIAYTVSDGKGGINQAVARISVTETPANQTADAHTVRTIPGVQTATTLKNIQNLVSGAGNDVLIGTDADNRFFFTNGWGNDVVISGGGEDALDFSEVTTAIQSYVVGNTTIVTTTDSSGRKHTITAFGKFSEIKLPGSSKVDKVDAFISKSPGVGAVLNRDTETHNTTPPMQTDQERIRAGLEAFATWSGNFGTKVKGIADSIPSIPFLSTSLSSVWSVTGQQVVNTIQTFKNNVNSLFTTNPVVTTADILSLTGVTQTNSSNAREFSVKLNVGSFSESVNLDFSTSALGELFGFDIPAGVQQSEPFTLTGGVQIEFVFGLDADGNFYVSNPAISAAFALGHQNPFDLSLRLGPLGIGIEGGTLKLNAEIRIGADRKLSKSDLAGDSNGSLIALPKLSGNNSYEIHLPIVLQGALAGLQGETAFIVGSFNTPNNPVTIPGAATITDLFASIATNIGTRNFEKLISIKSVSLDMLLDGISGVLDELIDPNGIAFKKLPLIDQSIIGLLGSGTTNALASIKSVVDTIRATLADVQSLERDLNFELDSALSLGLNLGGTKAEIKAAFDRLTAIAAELDSNSTDDEIAIAMALAKPEFVALIADRNVVLASQRLIALGLSKTSTDGQIALALVALLPSQAQFNGLKADRDLLAGNTAYLEAQSRLIAAGLSGESSDEEIQLAWSNSEDIARAKNSRNLLQGTGGTAIERTLATQYLSALGLSTEATDQQIEARLANSAEITQATADRDLVRDNAPAMSGAEARLAEFGLDANSSDEAIATALVDADTLQARIVDRDLLATTKIVLNDAATRLSAKSLSANSNEGDIALAVIDATEFAARKADRDQLAVYDANKIIALSYQNSRFEVVIRIEKHLTFEIGFSLDLDTLANDPSVPSAVRTLLGGAARFADLSASGSLLLDAFGRFDFGFGFDLSDITDPKFFVADNTGVTFGLDVENTSPLEFDAGITVPVIGTVGFSVRDGNANLTLRVRLGLKDNSNGTNQYLFTELIGAGFSAFEFAVRGEANIDLPVYFPTATFPMGGTTADVNGDGYGDNVLHIGMKFDSTSGGFSGLQIIAPDFAGGFDLFALLNDPQNIIAGLNAIFDGLRGALDSKFASFVLPFLGEELKKAANFIDDNIDTEAGANAAGLDLRDKVVGVTNAQGVYVSGLGKLLKVGVQELRIEAGFDEAFTLTLGEQETGLIQIGATSSATANNIKAALNELNHPTTGLKLSVTVEPAIGVVGAFDLYLGAGLPTVRSSSPNSVTIRRKTTIDILKEGLFNLLGPGGLDLLMVREFDADGTAKFDPATGLPKYRKVSQLDDIQLVADSKHIQLNVIIAGNIFNTRVPIDFDFAVPGIGLDVASDILLTMDYQFGFGFGFQATKTLSEIFYLDTAGVTSSGDEFELTLSATLEKGASLNATLAFLGAKLQEIDDYTPGSLDYKLSERASGVFASFAIDVVDPGTSAADQRLTIPELTRTPFSQLVIAKLRGEADLDVRAELGFTGVDFFKLGADIHFHQELRYATGGAGFQLGQPELKFTGIYIDLGSLISDFIGPILGEIQKITGPLQPVIDLLYTEIPVLSDVLGPTTLMSLAQKVAGADPRVAKLVQVIDAIASLITTINSIPASAEGRLYFGDYTVQFGSDGNPQSADSSQDNNFDLNSQLDNSNGSASTKNFLKGNVSKKKGQLEFPILTKPSTVFNLLLGKDVDLFIYTLPSAGINFAWDQTFQLGGPLIGKFSGSIDIGFELGFGFNTIGLRKYIATVDFSDPLNPDFGDPTLVFDGFFLADHVVGGVDNPEAWLRVNLGAGVGVGIAGLVEITIDGGVGAEITVDLAESEYFGGVVNENMRNPGYKDGRIFFDEIVDRLQYYGPLCVVDIHGDLHASLGASIWVGLDLGFFGEITIYENSWTWFEITLVDFDHFCTPLPPPSGASRGADGTLTLYMGNDYTRRWSHIGGASADDYGFASDGNQGTRMEVTRVKVKDPNNSSSPVLLDATRVKFDGYTQDFLDRDGAITKIVGTGGSGDEVVVISDEISVPVELHGGEGNDSFRSMGSGVATLFGDGGMDVLIGGIAHDILDGGAGNDGLEGGKGNDRLSGGGGDDTIYGQDGDDQLDGGDGNDRIKGGIGNDILWGGAGDDSLIGEEGNDWIFGEGGTDRIQGLDGDDTIYGGDDADTISGDLGIDRIDGGAGDDLITWRHGDGADTFITGGTGSDSVSMVASLADEVITFAAQTVPASTAITHPTVTITGRSANNSPLIQTASTGIRTTIDDVDNEPLILDSSDTENFILDAGDGADFIEVFDLKGTGVSVLTFDLGLSSGGRVVPIINYETQVDPVTGAPVLDQLGNPMPVLDANGNPVPKQSWAVDAQGRSSFPAGTVTGVVDTQVEQETTLTLTGNVVSGGRWKVNIEDKSFSVTATQGETLTNVAARLRSAIDADSQFAAVGTGETIVITRQGGGSGFFVSTTAPSQGKFTQKDRPFSQTWTSAVGTLTGVANAGDKWSIVLEDTSFDYDAVSGDTLPGVAQQLATRIDAHADYAATANGAAISITRVTPEPFLVSVTKRYKVNDVTYSTVESEDSDGQPDRVILHGGQGSRIAEPDEFKVTTVEEKVEIERVGVMKYTLIRAARTAFATTFDANNNPVFAGDSLQILGHGGEDDLGAGNMTEDLLSIHLLGQDGNDRLVGSPFSDVLDGGSGDDTFTGKAGVDYFFDSGGRDTLKETFDRDMSLFGDTFISGTILADNGNAFRKFSKVAEQNANQAARDTQASITIRDTAETPAPPFVSLTAPANAASQSTINVIGDQAEIKLIGTVLAGQTWTVVLQGVSYNYVTGSNGDPLSMVAVAKGLADLINEANTRYTAEDSGPEPIIHGILDTGDRYATGAEVESLIDRPTSTEIFEIAKITGDVGNNILVVGDSDNIIKLDGRPNRSVTDWKGIVTLDNRGSNDAFNEYYIIVLRGNGAKYYVEDNGGTGAYDELYIVGTEGPDKFSLNASNGVGIISSGDFYDANFPYSVTTLSSNILTSRSNVSTDVTVHGTSSLIGKLRIAKDRVEIAPQFSNGNKDATFKIQADHPLTGKVNAGQIWSIELDGMVYSYASIEGDTDASVAAQLARSVRGDNPAREDVNFNEVERLTVRTLGGNDTIISNDTAVDTIIEMGAGGDSITIGEVPTIPDRGNADFNNLAGIPIADTKHMSSGNSAVLYIYGGGQNDNFEVNHNVAELFLFGEAGDDRFVINTFLVLSDKPDDPGAISNLARLFGGTGTNRYEYLQNAPVNIFGGSGNDTVVINGTPIGDTFIITADFVAGAGRVTYFSGIEKLEVNGAGGDDRIYILGVPAHLEITVSGGSGNDEIHLGGDHPTLFFDEPAFVYQPPSFLVQDKPYIEYNVYEYDPGRFYFSLPFWGDRGLWDILWNNQGSLPGYIADLVISWVNLWYAYNKDRFRYLDVRYPGALPGLIQDTLNTVHWSLTWGHHWWDWDPWFNFSFDIPKVNVEYGVEVWPAPRQVTPPKIIVDPDPFAIKVEGIHTLDDIQGRIVIEGGEDAAGDNDKLLVHTKDGTSDLSGSLLNASTLTISPADENVLTAPVATVITPWNETVGAIVNGTTAQIELPGTVQSGQLWRAVVGGTTFSYVAGSNSDPLTTAAVAQGLARAINENSATYSAGDKLYFNLRGLGLRVGGVNGQPFNGVLFTTIENIDVRLGTHNDSFTIDAQQFEEPINIQLALGQGNDSVAIKGLPGETTILGGPGSETITVADDLKTVRQIAEHLHFDASGEIIEESAAIPYHAETHDPIINSVPYVFTRTAGGTLTNPIAQYKERILTGSRTAHISVLSRPTVGALSSGITELSTTHAQYWTEAIVTLEGGVGNGEKWILNLDGVDYSYVSTTAGGLTLNAVAQGLKNAVGNAYDVSLIGGNTLSIKRSNASPFSVQVIKGLEKAASIRGTRFNDFRQFELRGAVTAGSQWTVTLNGVAFTHTATASDTLQSIATALRNLIDAHASFTAQVNQYLDIFVVDFDPITGRPIKDVVQRRGVQERGYIETGFQLLGYGEKNGTGAPLYEDALGNKTTVNTGKEVVIIDMNNSSGQAVPLYLSTNRTLTTNPATGAQALQISQNNTTVVPLYRDGNQITSFYTGVLVTSIAPGAQTQVVPIQYDSNGNPAVTRPLSQMGYQAQGYQQYGYFRHNTNGTKTTTNIGVDYHLVYSFDDEYAVPLYVRIDSAGNTQVTTENISGSWAYIAQGNAGHTIVNLYLDANGNLTTVAQGNQPDWRVGFQRRGASGAPLYLRADRTLTTNAAEAYQQAIIVTNQLLYLDRNGKATLDTFGNRQWILYDNNGTKLPLYADADQNPTTRIKNPSVVIDNANVTGYAVPLFLDEFGDKTTQKTPNKAYAATNLNSAPLIYYDTNGLDVETADPPPVPRVQDHGTSPGTANYAANKFVKASIEVDRQKLVVGTRPFEMYFVTTDAGNDQIIVDRTGVPDDVNGRIDYVASSTTTTLSGLLPDLKLIDGTGWDTIQIRLGAGNDAFLINKTGAATTLKTGAGDDTITIGYATGRTFIYSESGADTLTLHAITADAEIYAGSEDDTITVGLAELADIDANNAQDKVGMNKIQAALTIHGEGGTDTLTVNDTADTSNNTGSMTSSRVSGLGTASGLTYLTLEHLRVHLGSGGDTFTVESSSPNSLLVESNDGSDTINIRTITAPTNVNTGTGNDEVRVGTQAGLADQGGDVNSISALLTIDAGTQTGSDHLRVDDTADTAGNTLTLLGDRMTGLGLAGNDASMGITYHGFEILSVGLGSGSEVLNLLDFPERTINIHDTGGSEIYNFQFGAATAALMAGTYNLTDDAGSNDQLFAHQNVAGTSIELNNFQLVNGRERINYSGLERQTLFDYAAKISVTTAPANAGVSDLGGVGLRIVAR